MCYVCHPFLFGLPLRCWALLGVFLALAVLRVSAIEGVGYLEISKTGNRQRINMQVTVERVDGESPGAIATGIITFAHVENNNNNTSLRSGVHFAVLSLDAGNPTSVMYGQEWFQVSHSSGFTNAWSTSDSINATLARPELLAGGYTLWVRGYVWTGTHDGAQRAWTDWFIIHDGEDLEEENNDCDENYNEYHPVHLIGDVEERITLEWQNFETLTTEVLDQVVMPAGSTYYNNVYIYGCGRFIMTKEFWDQSLNEGLGGWTEAEIVDTSDSLASKEDERHRQIIQRLDAVASEETLQSLLAELQAKDFSPQITVTPEITVNPNVTVDVPPAEVNVDVDTESLAQETTLQGISGKLDEIIDNQEAENPEDPDETEIRQKLDDSLDLETPEEEAGRAVTEAQTAAAGAFGDGVQAPTMAQVLYERAGSPQVPRFVVGEFEIALDPSDYPKITAIAAWVRNFIIWILTLLIVWCFIKDVRHSFETIMKM